MNDKEIIGLLNEIGNSLAEIEIKSRYAPRMTEIFRGINMIKEGISNRENNRKDDE